jgi:hypothetical protein
VTCFAEPHYASDGPVSRAGDAPTIRHTCVGLRSGPAQHADLKAGATRAIPRQSIGAEWDRKHLIAVASHCAGYTIGNLTKADTGLLSASGTDSTSTDLWSA